MTCINTPDLNFVKLLKNLKNIWAKREGLLSDLGSMLGDSVMAGIWAVAAMAANTLISSTFSIGALMGISVLGALGLLLSGGQIAFAAYNLLVFDTLRSLLTQRIILMKLIYDDLSFLQNYAAIINSLINKPAIVNNELNSKLIRAKEYLNKGLAILAGVIETSDDENGYLNTTQIKNSRNYFNLAKNELTTPGLDALLDMASSALIFKLNRSDNPNFNKAAKSLMFFKSGDTGFDKAVAFTEGDPEYMNNLHQMMETQPNPNDIKLKGMKIEDLEKWQGYLNNFGALPELQKVFMLAMMGEELIKVAESSARYIPILNILGPFANYAYSKKDINSSYEDGEYEGMDDYSRNRDQLLIIMKNMDLSTLNGGIEATIKLIPKILLTWKSLVRKAGMYNVILKHIHDSTYGIWKEMDTAKITALTTPIKFLKWRNKIEFNDTKFEVLVGNEGLITVETDLANVTKIREDIVKDIDALSKIYTEDKSKVPAEKAQELSQQAILEILRLLVNSSFRKVEGKLKEAMFSLREAMQNDIALIEKINSYSAAVGSVGVMEDIVNKLFNAVDTDRKSFKPKQLANLIVAVKRGDLAILLGAVAIMGQMAADAASVAGDFFDDPGETMAAAIKNLLGCPKEENEDLAEAQASLAQYTAEEAKNKKDTETLQEGPSTETLPPSLDDSRASFDVA